MKKHTVKFTLSNRGRQYISKSVDTPILCALGLESFLDLGKRLPNTLYVTISSQKFKNSFPIQLLHNRLATYAHVIDVILIDDVRVFTSLCQDEYLFNQLGSIKNDPTIHILFEEED